MQPTVHLYAGAQAQAQPLAPPSVAIRTHWPPGPLSQPCWSQLVVVHSQGWRVGAALGATVGLALGDVLGLAVGDTVSAHAWSVTRGPSPQLLVHM